MKFFVVSEVAEMLRISESLVYSLIESGKLRCHRFGNGRGKITISLDDLELYLSSCRSCEKKKRESPAPVRLKHLDLS
ncbi:Helix-turn-helix domain protein [Gimesia alba]|uniref:Helix-turn-helix domain protein n=1 Tax=Gimesia alba TaxID=2527973 RepID=A0A517RFB0_9PLAN|nr:Helix-turn-helix domain protein [Gimesia alba]